MSEQELRVFRKKDFDGMLRGMSGECGKKRILAGHWGGETIRRA
jgi:hypothetical protein